MVSKSVQLVNFINLCLLPLYHRCFCLLCLFNDFLEVFAKSRVGGWRAHMLWQKVHSCIWCHNLRLPPDLEFPLLDLPELFLRVAADLVDGDIGPSSFCCSSSLSGTLTCALLCEEPRAELRDVRDMGFFALFWGWFICEILPFIPIYFTQTSL